MSGLEPIPYADAKLRGVLERVRTIAMVGASSNWNRPGYFVMKYLQGKGCRVIPVNPGIAGGSEFPFATGSPSRVADHRHTLGASRGGQQGIQSREGQRASQGEFEIGGIVNREPAAARQAQGAAPVGRAVDDDRQPLDVAQKKGPTAVR
jgi:hypothetical protein